MKLTPNLFRAADKDCIGAKHRRVNSRLFSDGQIPIHCMVRRHEYIVSAIIKQIDSSLIQMSNIRCLQTYRCVDPENSLMNMQQLLYTE